jgi:hypothetical protein
VFVVSTILVWILLSVLLVLVTAWKRSRTELVKRVKSSLEWNTYRLSSCHHGWVYVLLLLKYLLNHVHLSHGRKMGIQVRKLWGR